MVHLTKVWCSKTLLLYRFAIFLHHSHATHETSNIGPSGSAFQYLEMSWMKHVPSFLKSWRWCLEFSVIKIIYNLCCKLCKEEFCERKSGVEGVTLRANCQNVNYRHAISTISWQFRISLLSEYQRGLQLIQCLRRLLTRVSSGLACFQSPFFVTFFFFFTFTSRFRLSDRSLPAKLVPTLADRGCRVVSATDPHGRNLRFLDPEPYSSLAD
jgi:hypothetical protein